MTLVTGQGVEPTVQDFDIGWYKEGLKTLIIQIKVHRTHPNFKKASFEKAPGAN